MSSSLFTKPSPPVTTSRQLPQHPKMRLSYILNPAPQTQTTVVESVVPEEVPLPEQPVSDVDVPSSPYSSDLIRSTLLYDPTLHSLSGGDHELSFTTQPPSRSGSSSLLASEDLVPLPDSLAPDLASDLTTNLLFNPNRSPEIYHDSRKVLGTPSTMNRDGNELMFTPDRSAICHSSLHISPLQHRDLNALLNNSLPPSKSQNINVPPSSSAAISQPLPQHPKMALSYILNPSPTVNETKPNLDDPKPVPPRMSRSPSPSLSESEVSSPVTSDFNFHGSPVLSQYPRSGTPPPNESQLSSPATTPPSSPRPIPHTIPDLPQMVQPPQHLPWEGAPPPGMNPRDHRAYQRAGVHWMLAEIFGPDIG
ncbi:hypothetical protein Clacol_000975 [Clathrus columnatus]|uniref:Uncharacterized protein n=1 Tax=Clathrus columnatus TaxID=1419009 RepID=A0AAV4ZXG7_9AGAM|nr:hypothetical protein Clacol_000975 [Clathrus columnatus]